MFAFLTKPYPYLGELRKDLKGNFFIGIFIAFFLIFFQPFGIAGWHTSGKLLKLAGFGLISALVPSIISLCTYYLVPAKLKEERWTIGFEILHILAVLLLIAFANLLYGRLLGVNAINLPHFMGAIFSTFLVGVFPVSFHVISKHNRLLRKNLEQSRQMNDSLLQAAPAIVQADLPQGGECFSLIAENDRDRLQLSLMRLLYIESADNYSSIFSIEDGQIKKQLIRSSLKRIESQLNNGSIIRCHRTYMVNLRQVREVEGNAAGYKLLLRHTEVRIPVSRSYVPRLNEKLKAIS